MQQTDDIAAWLTQIWDEDEALAKAATPGPWRHGPDKHWRLPGSAWFEEAVFAGPSGKDATCVAGTGESDDGESQADAAHIARHDPAAALARIAADRQILKRCVDLADMSFLGSNYPPGDMTELAAAILADLASAYADRPGYQEAWRP